MTDADVDGATSKSSLTFSGMPEPIDRGYLYIAQPPLPKLHAGVKAI
jgi:DNA gyrase subunit B